MNGRRRWAAVLARLTGLARAAGLAGAAGLVLGGCSGGGGSGGPGQPQPVAVVLSCGAAAGQQGPGQPPARVAGGVSGFVGDTNPNDTLPVFGQINGHRYVVWKAALAVAPGARGGRTVRVLSPGWARIAYGKPPLRPASQIRMPACGPRYTLFTGGILVRGPACVRLVVSGPGVAAVTIAVPVLDSGPCTAGGQAAGGAAGRTRPPQAPAG
ncbi:MAG TPA: hypothetical protein VGQ05_19750 [Streptosporangiaceae bacterium]|nr:hypothetical protein [Streptosporangiaceae bacterium]